MPTAFVDANMFVYAFLKPKRKLQPHEEDIRKIIEYPDTSLAKTSQNPK